MEMEQVIEQLEELIARWEQASEHFVSAETSFKVWEASNKKALMDQGFSAAKAEVQVRSNPEWESYYLNVQRCNIAVEKKKKQINLCQLRFDAARTARADARRIV